MSSAVTKADLDKLEKSLDGYFKRTNKQSENIDKQFQNVNTQFEGVDKQFDTLTALMSGFAEDTKAQFDDIKFRQSVHDIKFEKIEQELREQNKKYNHLVNTIDGFIGRIDRYETELAARDHKIARLERWIEELALTSGVRLT